LEEVQQMTRSYEVTGARIARRILLQSFTSHKNSAFNFSNEACDYYGWDRLQKLDLGWNVCTVPESCFCLRINAMEIMDMFLFVYCIDDGQTKIIPFRLIKNSTLKKLGSDLCCHCKADYAFKLSCSSVCQTKNIIITMIHMCSLPVHQ